MHRQEGFDQVTVTEGVAREVGHLFDAETFGHPIERAARQVHRAVLPALAPTHPAGVRFGRIEDEESCRRRLLDLAAALDHRAALLGDGDDQGFVRVRRIFVGREVGM